VRDEVQDFTRNVRAVSGGGGLIRVDGAGTPVPEGVAGLAQLPDLRPTANSGLSADLDAIATYLAVGVRAPISPIKGNGPLVKEGRALFAQAGCQHCHGGPNWTTSVLDATPPPAANDVVDAQLVRFLCRVGTFDADLFADGKGNEVRATARANGAGAKVQARGALGLKCTVAALGVRERAVSAQRRLRSPTCSTTSRIAAPAAAAWTCCRMRTTGARWCASSPRSTPTPSPS
jgi:hypothetical protein